MTLSIALLLITTSLNLAKEQNVDIAIAIVDDHWEIIL